MAQEQGRRVAHGDSWQHLHSLLPCHLRFGSRVWGHVHSAAQTREEEGNSFLVWPGREQLELSSQGRLHGGGGTCLGLWRCSGLRCSGDRGKQVTCAVKLHPARPWHMSPVLTIAFYQRSDSPACSLLTGRERSQPQTWGLCRLEDLEQVESPVGWTQLGSPDQLR